MMQKEFVYLSLFVPLRHGVRDDDVPVGQPMGISCFVPKEGIGFSISAAEIHIHEVGDLNGGGWQIKRDKATVSGTTQDSLNFL